MVATPRVTSVSIFVVQPTISVGKPYLGSHLKLIMQSNVNARDRIKYAIGVLDSVFTCQLDLIRQNDYTGLIPTCRRH